MALGLLNDDLGILDKASVRVSTETNLTTSEARHLVASDPDFVFLKRFDYSLAKVKERYPEGCPDRIVANAMMIIEDDVSVEYARVCSTLREIMGVTL